ncbi:ATP-binding protein [Idiomarina xiamenensis]|uniref:ATP-binding protein n=1 Tax=Idiomarina xiamenensis TaxID=1207041 RepID=UPI001ED985CE|nr:ATP-binding protein [Idiomarina xiamenensis]
MLIIVVLVTAIALLVAFSVNIVNQADNYRQSLLERSQAYAELSAFNALSTIVFDDSETESQRLQALRSSRFIEYVHVYRYDDVSGELTFFASYNKRGLTPIPAKFSQVEALQTPKVSDSYIEISEPILLDSNVVGYIYLRGSLDELNSFMTRSVLLSLAVFVLTLICSALLTIQLLKNITRPIDDVVSVIQQIARDKDYSLRLPQSNLRELDSISHAVNTMLGRIQKHISRQKQAEHEASTLNAELEKQVSERTQALKEANQELLKTLEQLHQYQSQLVESEKMASLGDMVAGIAHEVNTPIGLSVTASTLLQDKLQVMQQKFDNKQVSTSDFTRFLSDSEQNLDIIYRNLQRAAELITSFKQVAVDQTSEIDREIPVRQFMDDVLLSMKPKLRDPEQFPINVHCDESLVVVTKPGPLNQVLMNLIQNSMLHGFEGKHTGTIDISYCLTDSNELEITYRDDGCGVPIDIRRRIFDPFVTTKRGAGGSGLGMHLVYNLVTQVLNGSIHFFSEEHYGVEFVIRFPVKIKT